MDRDLLEQLYQKYYHAALLYTTALCGSEMLAEDIVADAFVKAYLSLPRDLPSFQYWLLRVCKNLWIDHLRRQRHYGGDIPDTMSDPLTPELCYITDQRNRALWSAVNSLPLHDRELIAAHYFSGLPLRDVAVLMGKSYAAVRQRICRLRQILKKQMEDQGYGF